jgi:hypothetical protein
MLEALRDILNDDSIVFRGAAIGNDIGKQDYYDIGILVVIDLQQFTLSRMSVCDVSILAAFYFGFIICNYLHSQVNIRSNRSFYVQ